MDNLIDARDVAAIVGLAHRNSVPLYVTRYGLPGPVVDLGPGRPKLWLRSEVTAWQRKRVRDRAARESERPGA